MHVVVVGDFKVGKSTLINAFINDKYDPDMEPINAAETYSKEMQFEEKVYTINITEVGDENQFIQALKKFQNGVDAALLVYDSVNYKSFVNVDWWVQVLRMHSPNIPILLIASKADLVENKAGISSKQSMKSKKLELEGFINISALNSDQVNLCFKRIVSLIV